MDHFWLITWTTYGSWLPGDRRGFVGTIRDAKGEKVTHNQPHTPCDADIPPLERYARTIMKGPPIFLVFQQAKVLFQQFRETEKHRGWCLRAVGIMANHIHLVVGVPGDPDPEKIRGDFKAYGSRVLNKGWGKPKSETWWTESGSDRNLPDEAALLAAIEYVRNQKNPLLIWIADDTEEPPAGGGRQPLGDAT